MPITFEDAVALAMKHEVGAFFNPKDPEVIAGLINTREQRRKVGYVNDPADRGGETKFGVAATANPTVNIAALTWPQAVEIYRTKYWIAGGCHLLSDRVALIHFDGCVNHGVGRASRFLQEVVGVTQDGQVGPKTAAAANKLDQIQICNSLAARREQFYQDIVLSNPSQAKFLNGWLKRINDVRALVTKPTF